MPGLDRLRPNAGDSAENRARLLEDGVWHTLGVPEVAAKLGTDPRRGVSVQAALQRLARIGPNRLTESQGRGVLSILLAQLQSLIVLLLVAATLIAFALGETVEGIAILIVIVLNSLIGFLTEWKAERALAALQKQTVALAQVVRDGVERQVPAADLVPGDVVILAAGGRVPADGRIIEAVRLKVEEASLTGESVAITKTPEPCLLYTSDAADE